MHIFHKWGKWEDTYLYTLINVSHQIRTCEVCGKKRKRYL